MKYKVRNLTYQPIRLIVGTFERILKARGKEGETTVPEMTNQLVNLEKKQLVKIRPIKD